jgi:hypothetical protein
MSASEGVILIQNQSRGTVYFQVRWGNNSSWTNYSLAPGYQELFWANNHGSLAPQIQFDWSYAPGYQGKSYALRYGIYNGSGTPPTSAAHVYAFRGVSNGIDLYDVTPPPLTTYGVVEFVNSTNTTVIYQFRWNSNSSWTSQTLSPGQGWYYSTVASGSLAPQIQFDWSFATGYQGKIYSLKYNTYTSTGTPPASAAHLYSFHNVTGGIVLFDGANGGGGGGSGGGGSISGLPLKTAYTGGFQDYVNNWNQGNAWWTNKAWVIIDPTSIHQTSTGVDMTGSITLYGWGGVSFTLPWTGTYHDFGSNDRRLDIGNVSSAPQGYTFGIHFYVTPQGGLTTIPADGSASNFVIQGPNLMDLGNDTGLKGRYIVVA